MSLPDFASPRKMRVAVEDLVSVFDNIPSIMNTMNAHRAEPGRFHILSPNHSHGMDSVLRGHSKKFGTSKQEKKRAQRMQQQAAKVLEHLSKLSEERHENINNTKRSDNETAIVALESIRNYAKQLGDESKGINKMYNIYDIHRKGKISSKDFQTSLLLHTPSLNTEEAKSLAKKIDKNNTGVINYTSILNALEELKATSDNEHKEAGQKSENNSVKFAPVDTQNNESKIAPWEIFNNNQNNNQIEETPMKNTKEVVENPLSKLTSPVVTEAPTSLAQHLQASKSQFPEFDVSAPHHIQPEYHNQQKHHFYVNNETTPEDPQKHSKHHFIKNLHQESSEESEFHGIASKDSYLAHNMQESDVWKPYEPEKVQDGPHYSLHHTKAHNMDLSENVNSLIAHNEELYKPNLRHRRKMEYTHPAAHKTISAPYYVDHQDEETLHETRRRSTSAPPALRKLHDFAHKHDHVSNLLKGFCPEVEKKEEDMIKHGVVVDVDDDGQLQIHKTGKKMQSQIVVNNTVKRHIPSLEYIEHDDINHFTLDPESSIVTQLDGHIAPLRHILKKADASNSGVLNYDELNAALSKGGVQIDQHQVKALFNQMARPMDVCHSFGYTKGKAVYIDEFVDRLQTRSSPLVSSLAESVMKASKEAAERKIMKEVLHNSDKTVDSLKIFKDLDEEHTGWITVDSLKEGLQRTGVRLTDNEFGSLVSKVSPNKEGKINVKEFKEKLKSDVHISDRDVAFHRLLDLHKHKRFTNTYKSDEIMYNNYLPEYEEVRMSKVGRKEELQWCKLKNTFQNHSTKLQSIFTKDNDKPELTIPEIVTRLANEGIPLGSDDTNRLKHYLSRGIHAEGQSEPKVSVNQFCNIIGVPVGFDHHNKIKVTDPADTIKDGGIFYGAEKSQSGVPTYATSYYVSGEENSAWVKGNRRAHPERPPYEHVYEPSKFWKLEHGAQAPEFILGVSPLPSTKDIDVTRSYNLYNRGRAAAGLRTTERSLHETSMFNDDGKNPSRRRVYNHYTDNVFHSTDGGAEDASTRTRRSLSAPPRSLAAHLSTIDLSYASELGHATKIPGGTGSRLNLSGGIGDIIGPGLAVPEHHHHHYQIKSLKKQVLPPSYAPHGTCPFALDTN